MMGMMDSHTATMYHPLLAIHRGRPPGSPEPLDCSTTVLNLSIKRHDSPSPPPLENNSSLSPPPMSLHQDSSCPASSTCIISSSSPDSENSAMSSMSPDPYCDSQIQPYVQSGGLNKVKIPRPFKAYPKNPLSLTTGVNSAIFDKDSVEAYSEFRKSMLARVQATHGITNKNMRRTSQIGNNNRHDPNYWEKRRKNNEAAKRSRDARRAKEDEIAIRAAFLEQENLKLRYELATTRNELDGIKRLMYSQSCSKMAAPYVGLEFST